MAQYSTFFLSMTSTGPQKVKKKKANREQNVTFADHGKNACETPEAVP